MRGIFCPMFTDMDMSYGNFGNADRSHRPLASGDSLGTMTVVASGERGLVLKGAAPYAIGVILLGVLGIGFGGLAWMAYLNDTGERVSTKWLVTLFGAIAVVVGVVQLNTRVMVDGERRTLTRGKSAAQAREAFSRVQITVLPTNLNQRETLRLELHPSDGKPPEVMGMSRTNKKRAFHVANAGYELARLLDLPLVVEGETAEAPEKLSSILIAIETPVTVTERRAA